MEFRLLGQFEALDDHGRRIAFRGQRPRMLLAILLLRANQVVRIDQLIAALWGEEPPVSARQSIHLFVHQLRRALTGAADQEPANILETHGSGYLLRVAPGELDLHRVETLVAQARAADTPTQAWDAYQQAAAVWRGPALLDFLDEPFAWSESGRLEDLRLGCLEEQFRVGLQLGRHTELTGEISALIRIHPSRERLRGLLMLALYRSGRQVEALTAYQDARAFLVGTLGIEPSTELQGLQRQILSQDPALEAPSAPARPVARSQPAAWTAPPPSGAPSPRSRDERKLVTVLVATIPQPAVAARQTDPEETRDRTAAVRDRMAGLVARYGGVLQPAPAGQLLAVFGADRNREDDIERAVRAALDLRQVLEGSSHPPVGAGVATGEAVVTLNDPAGATGHPDPEPLQVVGDVLLTAAALQVGAAPGTVLVGASTYRATSTVVDYEPVQPGTLPERAGGMEVWRALAPRARTGATVDGLPGSPLLERERELSLLSGLLERLLGDKEPQLLTLIGEPGLGKSRLVAELGRRVDQAPELVSWRVGRSPASGQGSLSALTEILKAQAGILDGDSLENAEGKFQQTVARVIPDRDRADRIAAQLRVLLGRGIATPPQGRPTQELLTDWIWLLTALAAQRPLVAVFEDLQWADDALLDFVDGLTGQAGPVPLAVLATARPEFLDRRPGWGGGKPNTATVSLSPLSMAGTTRLLDALLGEEQLPAATREALLAASGGNPLYVEEYVRMLRERPASPQAPDGALSIPETVQQVVAARIDALPVADKLLLQDAAVLGEVSWVGALATVSGREREEVAAGLARIERREFLRRARVASVAGETEYTFRHALIREVAYRQILRAERIDKHLRAAGWIEALNPDPGERIELLAGHYDQALTLTRAAGKPVGALAERVRHTVRDAGDRAMTLGSLTTAVQHYQHALELWPADDPTRPELLLRLGRALVYGRHTGEEVLTEASEASLAAGRNDLAAEADVLRSQLARIRTDTDAAEQHTRRWLDGPAGDLPIRDTVAALGSRAVQLLLADRHGEAGTAARQVVDLARQLGWPEQEGNGLSIGGHARILAGDISGLADAERGLALMDAHRFPLRVFAYFGFAHALWWYGDLQRCAGAVAAGRQVAEATDAAIAPWFGGVHAGLHYAAARWDDAVTSIDEALSQRHTGQQAYMVPWYQILRARIRLARGEVNEALADSEAATGAGDTRYRHVAMAAHARALHAAGRTGDAVRCLEALLDDQRTRPPESCATPDLALLLLDLDLRDPRVPEGLAPTRWHNAVQELAAGDLETAAERFDALGSPVDAAETRLRLARRHAGAGRRRAAQVALAGAVETFRTAGASVPFQAARKLQATLAGQ